MLPILILRVMTADGRSISDLRKCPSCAAETHWVALQVLIQKGQKAVLASNLDSNLGASTSESGATVTSAKRKKAGSILRYADLPLTDAQKSCVNIKLFQWVTTPILNLHGLRLTSVYIDILFMPIFPSLLLKFGSSKTFSMRSGLHIQPLPNMSFHIPFWMVKLLEYSSRKWIEWRIESYCLISLMVGKTSSSKFCMGQLYLK